MTTARIGVAQLSFWFGHANGFCALASRHPGVELVAVWDDDTARGRERAEHFGTQFDADLERLLARKDVHAVSLCAEPDKHPALVEAAAAAGKDIVVEKAMSGDLSGATRIVEAVRRNGVRLFPAFNLAWNPVPLLVKEIVDSGRLGSLGRVRRSHGHFGYAESGGFRYRDIAGNAGWGDPVAERRGSLYFIASHSALWFQWMFGPPRSVAAMTSTLSEDLPVEDNSTVLLRYPPSDRAGQERGFVGIMESSATQGATPLVAQLAGTRGDLVQFRGDLPSTRVWGPQPQPLAIFDRVERSWTYPELPPYFSRSEYEFSPHGRFLDALVAEEELPVDEIDGYNSIAIIVAAEQADREGREIEVRAWPAGEGASG